MDLMCTILYDYFSILQSFGTDVGICLQKKQGIKTSIWIK